MNRKLIIRVLGALLLIEAAAMLPSLAVALYYQDGDALPLFYSVLATAAISALMWFFTRTRHKGQLRLFILQRESNKCRQLSTIT